MIFSHGQDIREGRITRQSIRVVFFDVGSTLIYPDPSIAEVFVSTAKSLGYDVSLREVESHMPALGEFYEREYARDGDFWCSHSRAVEIWLDMYRLLARECGLTEGIERLAEKTHEGYLDARNWALYGDVLATLKGLKRRGFRLGIISNWDTNLESLLRDVNLLPYFDEVIASAAVGYRKPNPEIFKIACERMEVNPEKAIHVGDHPDADGDGAYGAGLVPVIIDRKNRFDACPYIRINVLSDLVSMI
ncbi:MAG: HAD family hydrolase [Eggerthellaceae bacterium]|jgi:putative hydrolase of the HAD superfamily